MLDNFVALQQNQNLHKDLFGSWLDTMIYIKGAKPLYWYALRDIAQMKLSVCIVK